MKWRTYWILAIFCCAGVAWREFVHALDNREYWPPLPWRVSLSIGISLILLYTIKRVMDKRTKRPI